MTIDIEKKANALANMAASALHNGEIDKSIELLISALHLVPDLPKALICISEFEPDIQEMLIKQSASIKLQRATLQPVRQNESLKGKRPETPPTRRIIPLAIPSPFSDALPAQKSFLLRFFSRWQSALGFFIIFLFIAISIAAPYLAPQPDPENQSVLKKSCLDRRNCPTVPPNANLPLGSIAEYDVYFSLIWGTRQAVFFGFSCAFFTAAIGSLLGLWAGYAGGKTSTWIMRVTDAFLCFPQVAAVALFASINLLYNNPSLATSFIPAGTSINPLNTLQTWIINSDPVFLALVIFSWMPYTRILRAQTQLVKKMQYTDAAVAIGVKPIRVLFKHILPNASPPAIVLLAKDIGRMVVLQTTFSFLGLGSESAWGILLARAVKWILGIGAGILRNWWVYLPITGALLLFGIAWNLLGDELNLWLNPREARKIF